MDASDDRIIRHLFHDEDRKDDMCFGDWKLIANTLIGKTLEIRRDQKICTAQRGECRYNWKFNSHLMGNFWDLPIADDSCPENCLNLRIE